ncbi:MAG: hypothetical protein JWO05_3537 [Gemmatimonadetes bacterium]|nr:hypothetical protein [Gemmatimonadota bacterium]
MRNAHTPALVAASIVIAFASTGPLAAQQVMRGAPPAGPRTADRPFTVPRLSAPRSLQLADAGASIALPAGRAPLTVQANGVELHLILETTGGPSELTDVAVAKLGLATRTHGGDTLTTATLDSVRVGDVTLRGLETVVTQGMLPPGIDGFIGLNAFRDLLLTIDRGAGTLQLSRGSLPAVNGTDVVAFLDAGRNLGFEIALGDQNFPAVVNSMSDGFANVPPAWSGKVTFAGPLEVVGQARFGGGEAVDIKGAALKGAARVGAVSFDAPRISVVPNPAWIPDVVSLGRAFLDQATITFDQKNGRVRVTPAHPGRGPSTGS